MNQEGNKTIRREKEGSMAGRKAGRRNEWKQREAKKGGKREGNGEGEREGGRRELFLLQSHKDNLLYSLLRVLTSAFLI